MYTSDDLRTAFCIIFQRTLDGVNKVNEEKYGTLNELDRRKKSRLSRKTALKYFESIMI